MGSVEKRTRTLKSGKVTTFYLARWREPNSTKQPSKSFPKSGLAWDHVHEMEGDKLRGEYIPKDAGKITFEDYATEWLAAQTFEESTREAVDTRLRVHAFPVLGARRLAEVKPSTIQGWLRRLTVGPAYRRVIFAHVSTVFNAAVADELIRKNPCSSSAVTKPKVPPRRIQPWTMEQVESVRSALSERYRIVCVLGAGLGLRQGEVFGLAVEDVDFLRGRVTVRRQVKMNANKRQYFGPPKGGKERIVPLPSYVRDQLAAHISRFPSPEVSLPWRTLNGKPVSARLIVSTYRSARAVRRHIFNNSEWAPALKKAGLPRVQENGMHMLRHVYASTLLHAGESIKAVSAYLGHSSAAFTLATYTHLLPESDERTRSAVDDAFGVTSVELGPPEGESSQVRGDDLA